MKFNHGDTVTRRKIGEKQKAAHMVLSTRQHALRTELFQDEHEYPDLT